MSFVLGRFLCFDVFLFGFGGFGVFGYCCVFGGSSWVLALGSSLVLMFSSLVFGVLGFLCFVLFCLLCFMEMVQEVWGLFVLFILVKLLLMRVILWFTFQEKPGFKVLHTKLP